MTNPKDPGGARFRLLDELGRGGFGSVSRSFDRVLRRQVARKTALRSTPWQRDQMLHEARLLAWLDHPGVVPVHDVQTGAAGDAVTMALVAGENLADHLSNRRKRREPMPVSEALRVLRRLSETLANAHHKGVLHLDLKPANVVLQPYGRVILLDWGAARFFDRGPYEAHMAQAGEDVAFTLPTSPTVSGTPAYMPPEQALGQEDELGPWSDVYAAGVLLYELLTNTLPHEVDGNALAWAHARMTSAPRPVGEIRADIPQALAALSRQMLAPDPSDRPRSFEAVLARLDALTSPGVARETRRLAPGELLFAEGDQADVAWLILSGNVEVFVGTGTTQWVLGTRSAGQVVGEVALLTDALRSASIRAVGPAVVSPVGRDDIEAELAKVSPLVSTMVRHLSTRLRESITAGRAPQATVTPESHVEALLGVQADAAELGTALDALSRVDPPQARLATLRLLGGFSLEDASSACGLDNETARREWRMARAMLRRTIAKQRK